MGASLLAKDFGVGFIDWLNLSLFHWKSIYHVAGCSNFPSAKTNRTGTRTLVSV